MQTNLKTTETTRLVHLENERSADNDPPADDP
jgi:hypothetical protein